MTIKYIGTTLDSSFAILSLHMTLYYAQCQGAMTTDMVLNRTRTLLINQTMAASKYQKWLESGLTVTLTEPHLPKQVHQKS